MVEMAVGERQRRKTKMPSFSSSLLDAIYHSIDDQPNLPQRRNVDDEIESLRRAIMVEKWMENYSHTATARHLPSNSSSSSTDSIFTSSSETDSSSTPKPEREGRFTRTKSKIYGDLKKLKEPVSPAARIASFWNSIFTPRNKDDHPAVRKSRSMKLDTAAATSRSCLTTSSKTKNVNKSKSKRCVRFCPFLDQHSSLVYKERDFDDKSCASSDLFELENIGPNYDQELPVYGTTNLQINRAIATGFNIY